MAAKNRTCRYGLYWSLSLVLALGAVSCGDDKNDEGSKEAAPSKTESMIGADGQRLKSNDSEDVQNTSNPIKQDVNYEYTHSYPGFKMSARWTIRPEVGKPAAIVFKWSDEEKEGLIPEELDFSTEKLGCGCQGNHKKTKAEPKPNVKEIEVSNFILTKGGKWEFVLQFKMNGAQHEFKGIVECAN